MDRVYTIRTPEMVRFDYRLAGPLTRLFAWAIDIAVLFGALAVIVFAGCIVSAFLSFGVGTDLGWAIVIFVAATLYYGYFGFFEWLWSGRTFGKQVLGLRVLQSHGMRISAFHAIARNLVRTVDSLFPLYTVGGLALLVTRRAQRIGDLVAGTIVVRDEKPDAVPSAKLLAEEARNPLLLDRGLARRMARRLTKDERELLVDAARRADEIDLEVRGPLFARLAGHYSSRLGMARDPHVSDEKLVQNLARALLAGEREGEAGGV
jgi:uncharacterized RDD family membrane protein YckC